MTKMISDAERQDTQMAAGIICFAFLAVLALVIQLISGYMVAWTVMGIMGLVFALVLLIVPRFIRV
mgnify:CR=1 FL=1